jgi:nitrile hydratase
MQPNRTAADTVVFDGHELWGADADPAVKVSIDSFEPYLDPA